MRHASWPRSSFVQEMICLKHWNGNVVILTKFSSLAALKVVILTTFGAASDENFIKMMTFPFLWIRRQAIIWTNANVPPIGTPGKTSGEILINTTFSDGQMHLKNVYANCQQIENDMSKSLRSNDANIRAVFQYEYVVFPGMGFPLKRLSRWWDCLIFVMWIPILARRHLYIETAPILIVMFRPPRPPTTLQWRHNERDGVLNHRRLDCLHSRLFKRR